MKGQNAPLCEEKGLNHQEKIGNENQKINTMAMPKIAQNTPKMGKIVK